MVRVMPNSRIEEWRGLELPGLRKDIREGFLRGKGRVCDADVWGGTAHIHHRAPTALCSPGHGIIRTRTWHRLYVKQLCLFNHSIWLKNKIISVHLFRVPSFSDDDFFRVDSPHQIFRIMETNKWSALFVRQRLEEFSVYRNNWASAFSSFFQAQPFCAFSWSCSKLKK